MRNQNQSDWFKNITIRKISLVIRFNSVFVQLTYWFFIYFSVTACPARIHLLKVNNRNTRTRCELCWKVDVFIVNLELISHLVQALLGVYMLSVYQQRFISFFFGILHDFIAGLRVLKSDGNRFFKKFLGFSKSGHRVDPNWSKRSLSLWMRLF